MPKKWSGFSESFLSKGEVVAAKPKPKSVSFKNPISSYKVFNCDDPPLKINNYPIIDCELNFTSVSGLLDTTDSNTLPYVKIKLGQENNVLNTVGLLDTGCSWSICEYKTFIKIPNFKDFIINEVSKAKISCANDSSMKVEYKAKLPITFEDEEDNCFTVWKTFFVVRNLIHPVFLGYEIIDGKIAKAIYPDSLLLVNPKDKTKDVKIPIIRQLKEPEINFCCAKDTYFLPFQSNFVKVKPDTDILSNKPFIIDAIETENEIWQITPCIQELSSNGEYFVKIKNLTEHPIGFTEELPIAKTLISSGKNSNIKAYSITISDNECSNTDLFINANPIDVIEKYNDVHTCNAVVNEDKYDSFTANDSEKQEAWKEINDMPELTVGEKDLLYRQYLKKGFYQIPCNYLYQDSRHYCEFPIEKDEKVLTPEEVVDSFELSHLSKPQQYAIRELVKDFMDIWATREWDIGVTDLVECDVELKPEAKSKVHNAKLIPMDPVTKRKVIEMLEEMRLAGVVGKCPDATNFVSNILIIPKHNDKTKFRFLIDLRMVNNCSLSIPTKFTPLEEVLQFMCNKKWLTCCDIANGFYQLRVKPEKIPLFSFLHPSGEKWALFRSPQGYCNSPFYFTQLMAVLTRNLPHCTFFADDIFTATENKSEVVDGKLLDDFQFHLHALRQLFTEIRKANIKMKPNKVKICTSNITVLGFRYNNRKFSIPEAKVRAFLDWEIPKTRKKLVGFLQSVNYYSRCLKDLSTIKFPLQEMTRASHQSFKWDQKAQNAFEAVKACIKNHKNLTPFLHSLQLMKHYPG